MQPLSSSIRLSDCWAKTDPVTGRPALTVRDHCLIVGAVAEEFLSRLPSTTCRLLPAGAATMAALHDLGKITAGFLSQCQSWKRSLMARGLDLNRMQSSSLSHAGLSQTVVGKRLGAAANWAYALGGHHGRFTRLPAAEHPLSEAAFALLRDELTEELVGTFGRFPELPPPGGTEDREYPHIAALCGFIILCDWLGSDEENFPLPTQGTAAPPLQKSAASAGAITAISRRRLVQPGIQDDVSFGSLFTPRQANPYSPNELQTCCAGHIDSPGLYLVEAPMGMGKTEAALWAAARLISSGRAAGLYFALPTQLTSNKIHERVGSFLSNALPPDADATLALAHSASWLREPATFRIVGGPAAAEETTDSAAARSWFTSCRALLARYGVGTIDQALMASLPVKWAALRMFGLAGKVVILDEVHSYDAYTARLIDCFVKDMLALDSTVIVLSATLTEARRRELMRAAGSEEPLNGAAPYPALTICKPGAPAECLPIAYHADLPRHEVQFTRVPIGDQTLPESTVAAIFDHARRGARVLIVRNTVALAQATFSLFAQEGVERGLIHSRFPHHVRYGADGSPGIEDQWVARLGKSGHPAEGCILVSTQLVEQSLDIDADLLVTDLCPADLLLQRIGRLWRHMQARPAKSRPLPRPETWLLLPDLPQDPATTGRELDHALRPHSRIYPAYQLLRTLDALGSSIQLPSGIRPLLESCHAELRDEPSAWGDLREALEKDVSAKIDKAAFLRDRYLPPADDDEFRAPTRLIDMETTSLLLLSAPPRHQPGNIVELRFHDGSSFDWHPGSPWQFPLAKAVFLNSLRLPVWQVPKEPAPEWLSMHSHGPAHAAWIAENGTLHLVETGTPLPFRYEKERGLVFVRDLTPPKDQHFDSQQDDEYPF